MDNSIFSAYLCLQVLPDEVKKRNGIKVGATVPRLDVVRMAGNYPPLDKLKNPKGQIFFKLNHTRGIIRCEDSRRTDLFLGAIGNQLNFSSVYLLDYKATNGKIIGYGNPPREKTYGKKTKSPNPFFNCRNDGFLFVIAPNWQTIEILIAPDGYNIILAMAKEMADGKYCRALETMRTTARTLFEY